MSTAFSTADLRTALRFPFQSKGWLNHFLVGSALFFANSFIPFIPAIFVYGYCARLMRHTVNGQALALPEWNDWGGLFKDGLRSTAIGFLYLGPGAIVMLGGSLIYFMAIMVGVIATDDGAVEVVSPVFPLFMFGAVAVLFISMALGWALWTLGAVPMPLALAHSAARQQFLAAFDLRALGQIIRADKWGYLLSWVIVMGLVGVIYLAFMLLYFTVILCLFSYVFLAPLGFYAMLVAAAVFGNFYRENMPAPALLSASEAPAAVSEDSSLRSE